MLICNRGPRKVIPAAGDKDLMPGLRTMKIESYIFDFREQDEGPASEKRTRLMRSCTEKDLPSRVPSAACAAEERRNAEIHRRADEGSGVGRGRCCGGAPIGRGIGKLSGCGTKAHFNCQMCGVSCYNSNREERYFIFFLISYLLAEDAKCV